MRVGVVYPQTELGADPGAIRSYGQRVEELGYRHILAYDHVVGADPTVHPDWNRAYDVHTTFCEPLVMFGYLAALTQTVELVTGVIILPQRQTVLVAKQAAEVIYSAAADFGSVSAWVGTPSNSRRSGRTSPTVAHERTRKSPCYAHCGVSRA